MFSYRKCYDGKCPIASQLPLGILNPTSANESRALNRTKLIRNNQGTVVIPDGTGIKTGYFVASSQVAYIAPSVIATVMFDKCFRKIPVISVVLDDYGYSPSWIIHIRNITLASFDLVLKNADKPLNTMFVVHWSAVGDVD